MKNYSIATFALSAFLATQLFADETELNDPAEIVYYAVQEARQFNFKPKAQYTHPVHLAVYRRTVVKMIDRCVEKYGEEAVMIALDLPDGLSDISHYSDQEFYVHVSECVATFLPDSDPAEIEVVGVVECEGKTEVIYRNRVFLETVAEPGTLKASHTIPLERYNGRWMISGSPLRFTERALNLLCRYIKEPTEM